VQSTRGAGSAGLATAPSDTDSGQRLSAARGRTCGPDQLE